MICCHCSQLYRSPCYLLPWHLHGFQGCGARQSVNSQQRKDTMSYAFGSTAITRQMIMIQVICHGQTWWSPHMFIISIKHTHFYCKFIHTYMYIYMYIYTIPQIYMLFQLMNTCSYCEICIIRDYVTIWTENGTQMLLFLPVCLMCIELWCEASWNCRKYLCNSCSCFFLAFLY